MDKILILGDNYYVEKYFENKMSIFKIPKKKNVISFLKTNDINNIYICNGKSKGMDFYKECMSNDINILNHKIFFKDSHSIERSVRYPLNIPILRRTNVLSDYNNLVIESLERSFPQLLKSDDNVLLKINSSAEFIDYKDYIKNFINFFNYNSNIYLQEIPKDFRKVAIMFFINNDNEFFVMDSFDIQFTILKFNVIMKSPSIFINDLMKEDCEKISRKFGLKFGMVEFILNESNVIFYKLLTSDQLFHFTDYLKDIHEFDIYKFKFENGVYNKKIKNNTPKLLINEITLNYGNFFPFFSIYNGKTNFFSKCYVHWGNNMLDLLRKCENLYFKEIIYKFENNIKQVTYNIYNKNNTYFFHIKNRKNCDILFKNPQNSNSVGNMNRNIYNIYPKDTLNAKLANFILNNSIDSTILEISCTCASCTDICLIIYNKTFITVTGSNNTNIYVNNKQYKLNSVVKIECMDELIIEMKDYSLNYISFSNGIKLNLSKRISDYSKLINNGYILFNKPKNTINKNNNAKLLLPTFYSNYGLKVIESAFTDKFDPKMIKYIYKLKWSVKKVSDKGIILVNKHYGKLYKKYNIDCSILKRYCKGSVIFNEIGLLIVNNNNYDYYEGLSIMTIISSDNWKMCYIKEKSHLNFQKVSLDYAINKRVGIDNIFNRSDLVYRKMNNLDGIKRTKTVLLSFIDKSNLINIECRLMGDKHLIVEYNLDVNNKLKDNMFIEFGFRQKLIENNTELNIIFGLSSYIVKFEEDDVDKVVMSLYNLEKKISLKKNVLTRIVKLPVVLDRKYFSDKKYVESLLKINEINDIDDVKNFIEKMKFFVVDINGVNPGTLCLIPHNPVDRIIFVKRDINQLTENGNISFGNFFCNLHYSENLQNNTIIAKTIPLTDKNYNFILNRFDTVMFKMINNNSFNSIIDHNKNEKYFIDINDAEFNIGDYRNFFNSGLKKFIEKKNKKIKIYENEKNIHNNSIPNDIVNIHHIKAPFNCTIKEIYIKLNDNIKFTDKLCKIVGENNVKSNMKSNMIGIITSIHVSIGEKVEEGDTIISVLQC